MESVHLLARTGPSVAPGPAGPYLSPTPARQGMAGTIVMEATGLACTAVLRNASPAKSRSLL